MIVYIDSEFKCHTSNPNSAFQAVEHEFFDNKCSVLIEGYRFIPSGESLTCSDGTIFAGEMIAPWKPYNELDAAQREYERQLLREHEANIAEYEANLAELDALVLNFQYNNLIGEL